MTTNRYMVDTMIKKPIPAKKKLLLSNEEQNAPFVTRNELANFTEQILDSFNVIFTSLGEFASQSSYNTETLESLVNAVEDLNKENEKRHRELIAALEKVQKTQK